MTANFIHLRKIDKEAEELTFTDKEGIERAQLVFAPGAITIAYRHLNQRYVRVGICFCSPTEKGYSKRKGRKIALHRLDKTPLDLMTEDDEDFESSMLVPLLRTMLISPPTWRPVVEGLPLNPGRFDMRMSTEIIGPDGNRVIAAVDGRRDKSLAASIAVVANGAPAKMTSWVLRFPGWAKAFLEELYE